MSPLDAACDYAVRGWPVFPCNPKPGSNHKRPLTRHGLLDASADRMILGAWWTRWPDALVGLPTGATIGAAVLDVDVKRAEANGYDTLDGFGFAILPVAPMVHTHSGGLHLYFALPNGVDIRNTQGTQGRGIGPGLDWRGSGGYVIAPSPGSGYGWDPHFNLGTVPLAAVPPALLPRELARVIGAKPTKPETGLSRYAEAALDDACRRIITAPAGEQEATLNGEAFTIGTLAGAGGIPANFARRALTWAARQIPSYDHCRLWRAADLDRKVARAFRDGMLRPRGGAPCLTEYGMPSRHCAPRPRRSVSGIKQPPAANRTMRRVIIPAGVG